MILESLDPGKEYGRNLARKLVQRGGWAIIARGSYIRTCQTEKTSQTG